MFSIGWGNGVWSINLAAKNVFNKGWLNKTWIKNSPLYSEYQQIYSPSGHASINLGSSLNHGAFVKIERIER